MTVLIVCASCNNEWESEQYVQMVSFKAPVNAQGVTPIYIRYKPEGKVTYQLPLIVSGSTMNSKDLNVHVGLDLDTLDVLNVEHFGSRKELFFKPLENKYYEFPETVQIPAGECTSLLPIDFALKDLDQVDKWVLPLAIQSNDPSHNYQANPRKFYRRAMLRISPFNDYSGQYSATAYKVYFKGNEKEAIVPEYHTSYVIDDKTIFFYAGLIDIDRLDRKYYKIKFEFTEEKKEFKVEYNEKIYRAVLKKFKMKDAVDEVPIAVLDSDDDDADMFALYLFDDTRIQQLSKENKNDKMIPVLIYIDNYEKVLQSF